MAPAIGAFGQLFVQVENGQAQGHVLGGDAVQPAVGPAGRAEVEEVPDPRHDGRKPAKQKSPLTGRKRKRSRKQVLEVRVETQEDGEKKPKELKTRTQKAKQADDC